MCVSLWFGWVRQHVEAWSFVQRRVYIPQTVKDWWRCSLTFSLSFSISLSFYSLFSLVVLMGHTESHSQAAHSSCHDGNWQGVHSKKRRGRRIEAKINRDWVGRDCLMLICRRSKRRIYVYVWVCGCVMRKWMHEHANMHMAAGNYWWLLKGKIQNALLLVQGRRCLKCEFSLFTHSLTLFQTHMTCFLSLKQNASLNMTFFQCNESEWGIRLSCSKMTKKHCKCII